MVIPTGAPAPRPLGRRGRGTDRAYPYGANGKGNNMRSFWIDIVISLTEAPGDKVLPWKRLNGLLESFLADSKVYPLD